MAVPIVKGVTRQYTPTVNTLISNVSCNVKVEWQTDPNEPQWMVMDYKDMVRVAKDKTIHFRSDKDVELATAGDLS